MKKTIITILIFSCLYGLYSFFNSKNNSQSMNVENLGLLLNQIKIGQEVSLKNLTDFDWDQVYIVPPYSDPKSLNNIQGLERIESSIQVSDTINLIIFVKENQLTNYAEIPRDKADFSFVTRKEFKSDEAIFVKKKSPVGTTFINKFKK
ncbi:hypothetical protein [Paenibacillus sp. KN14-4R]|uniref:hypothetical protein n=1 Tax=Paenibacillus sp. KN14-4R TaxID=3445773 RepID=UPI003F9F73F8